MSNSYQLPGDLKIDGNLKIAGDLTAVDIFRKYRRLHTRARLSEVLIWMLLAATLGSLILNTQAKRAYSALTPNLEPSESKAAGSRMELAGFFLLFTLVSAAGYMLIYRRSNYDAYYGRDSHDGYEVVDLWFVEEFIVQPLARKRILLSNIWVNLTRDPNGGDGISQNVSVKTSRD